MATFGRVIDNTPMSNGDIVTEMVFYGLFEANVENRAKNRALLTNGYTSGIDFDDRSLNIEVEELRKTGEAVLRNEYYVKTRISGAAERF